MPYPPHDGGAIAMYDVLNGLAKAGHEVTLFAINTTKHYQQENVLNDIAKSVITVDLNTKINVFKAFLNLFKKVPYNFERFINSQVERQLEDLLRKEKFDIIQIEGAQIAYYIKVIKNVVNTPVVMRTHNVESLIWLRLAKSEKNIFKKWYYNYLSKGVNWYEKKYLQQYDKIVCITEKDKKLFLADNIKIPMSVIPAGIDMDKVNTAKANSMKNTLFMLGDLNWKPNEEGLKWFLNNVWSNVMKSCPDIELHIAGKNMPKWLERNKEKNIKVHGYVPSSEEFIKNYDVMLVPLLSGSGMRLKIIEGMVYKKPIISTSVGVEGIECTDNKNIFIRNNVDDWIKLISAYYRGKINLKEIGENAHLFVKEMHDNKNIINQFIQEYKALIG